VTADVHSLIPDNYPMPSLDDKKQFNDLKSKRSVITKRKTIVRGRTGAQSELKFGETEKKVALNFENYHTVGTQANADPRSRKQTVALLKQQINKARQAYAMRKANN
jgi:hypothetical protein